MARSKRTEASIATRRKKLTAIGIDPGQSGGIAVIPARGRPVAYDMPKGDDGVLSKLRSIASSINGEVLAFVEHAPAGRIKTMKISRIVAGNERAMQMALTACGIEWRSISVDDWQRHFGLYRMREDDRDPDTGKIVYIKGNEKKKVHVRAAEVLWPFVTFRTEGNRFLDGRADAMFIAAYGMRNW